MTQRELLNRSLEAGKDVAQRTQDQIEAVVRDVSNTAEAQATQVQQVMQDLFERSRATTEALVDSLDRELREQISALGEATRTDFERLEALIRRSVGVASDVPAGRASATKKSAATSVKKATVKRAAKKAAAKKSVKKVAKKTAVKKSVKKAATKSAAKKSVKKSAKASAVKKAATKAAVVPATDA